jgi:hypothetical protein
MTWLRINALLAPGVIFFKLRVHKRSCMFKPYVCFATVGVIAFPASALRVAQTHVETGFRMTMLGS